MSLVFSKSNFQKLDNSFNIYLNSSYFQLAKLSIVSRITAHSFSIVLLKNLRRSPINSNQQLINFKIRYTKQRETRSKKHRSVFVMARTKQRSALKSTGDNLDQRQELFNSSGSPFLSSTSSSSSDSGSSSTSLDESADAHKTFTGFWFTYCILTASFSNAYLLTNFFVKSQCSLLDFSDLIIFCRHREIYW